MTRVRLESIGVDVDPDKRIVYMEDGTERGLTRREYQAFKAQVSGATSIREIASIMSADDQQSGMGGHGVDTVDASSARKHLSTLRDKLGMSLVPRLKRGRKK